MLRFSRRRFAASRWRRCFSPDPAASAQSLQDKIAQCAACHGEDGQSKDPKIPHIGGQPKLAVMYQLFFYREGRRKSAEMNIIAKELTDAELTRSPTTFKAAATIALGGQLDEARFKRGAELPERLCASCHNADTPAASRCPASPASTRPTPCKPDRIQSRHAGRHPGGDGGSRAGPR